MSDAPKPDDAGVIQPRRATRRAEAYEELADEWERAELRGRIPLPVTGEVQWETETD